MTESERSTGWGKQVDPLERYKETPDKVEFDKNVEEISSRFEKIGEIELSKRIKSTLAEVLQKEQEGAFKDEKTGTVITGVAIKVEEYCSKLLTHLEELKRVENKLLETKDFTIREPFGVKYLVGEKDGVGMSIPDPETKFKEEFVTRYKNLLGLPIPEDPIRADYSAAPDVQTKKTLIVQSRPFIFQILGIDLDKTAHFKEDSSIGKKAPKYQAGFQNNKVFYSPKSSEATPSSQGTFYSSSTESLVAEPHDKLKFNNDGTLKRPSLFLEKN